MSVIGILRSDKIVIVPPEPEIYLSEHLQQLTYWHVFQHELLEFTKHKSHKSEFDEFNAGIPIATSSSSNSSSSISEEKKTEDPADPSDPADPAAASSTDATAITRDPRNGTFTFSVNSEYDLLLHIQRALDRSYRTSGTSASFATSSNVETAEVILRSIDDYCMRKQWMYHVGNEKSKIIADFLERGVNAFVERNFKWKKGGRNTMNTKSSAKNSTKTRAKGTQKTFVCVELGTYCGYSALVLASTLQRLQNALSHHGDHGGIPFQFHIYTTEVNSKFLSVAQNILRLSHMEQFVTTILIEDGSNGSNGANGGNGASLSDTLKHHLPADSNGIDFLLLDHAKNLYLPNVMELESEGLLRQHSYVCADNVVFNRLDEYRDHMKKWEEVGVVQTSLEEIRLEYSTNLNDGMEMTIYLKDLPNGQENGWWGRVWKKSEQNKETQENAKKPNTPLEKVPGAREFLWWKRVIRRNLEQTASINGKDGKDGKATSETALSLPDTRHKGFWQRLILGKLDPNTNVKNDANVARKGFWRRLWRK